MARTLRVVKDYSDVQERNVFIAGKPVGSPQIGDALTSAVKSATEKVCAVLESGLTDSLMQILLSNPKARKYIIVPLIKEEKLQAASDYGNAVSDRGNKEILLAYQDRSTGNQITKYLNNSNYQQREPWDTDNSGMLTNFLENYYDDNGGLVYVFPGR